MLNSNTANIQNLSRAVLRSAEHEAQKILSEAEDRVNEVRHIAQQECEEKHHKIIAKALKEADFIKNKNLAMVESEVQMNWLVNREKLIDQVFEQALASLHKIVDQDDYQAIVENLVAEAVFQLNDTEICVCFDEKANQLMDDAHLQQIAEENGVSIKRGEVLQDKLGVIAQTVDGHRQFDNTLQARLGRMKSRLRLPVYQILIGEG